MRKIYDIIIALVFLLAVPMQCLAANDEAQLFDETSKKYPRMLVTIEGTITSYTPNGIIIDTGKTIQIILGLGPQWYWDSLHCEKPQIGEFVTITVCDYDLFTGFLLIAQSIVYDSTVIPLRDVHCQELWE